MTTPTVNYGLAGGTLDATAHIERAIERGLITTEERRVYTAAQLRAAINAQPGRRQATQN